MGKKYVDVFSIDYINVLKSISVLIKYTEEEIMERINCDEDEMFLFLSGLVGILIEEKAFLLIDNKMTEKVLNIACLINDKTDLAQINASYSYSILYFLRDLNKLNDSEKNSSFFEYVSYNEDKRDEFIKTKKELYKYLEYDYIVIEKLSNDEFDFDKDLFLASSYYLTKVIPDIYTPKMVENSLKFLEMCQDQRYFRDKVYKNKVRSLKKYFNKFDNSDNSVSQFIKFKDKE